MKRFFCLWLALTLCVFASVALATYDAQTAESWLEQFAAELSETAVKNDVLETADPARAGQYLLEYDFGTVTADRAQGIGKDDILRVELKMPGTADCRGLSVGQTLEDVIGGREIIAGDTPLYVLETQDAGYGWSWAYLRDGQVYGVEYITYGGGTAMKEYTLTYVVEQGAITAIRMQIADATLSQAQEGLSTAEEIAGRQLGEVIVDENGAAAFSALDMTVRGIRAVGVPVEELIAAVGEPQAIQTLADGTGRMLIYADLVAELAFDEMTGVERVRSVSCASMGMEGPRGLRTGMSVQEAAALWRCDNTVYSCGGVLYLAGEAQGVAPYGELIRDGAGAYTLRYTCILQDGSIGVLSAGIADGAVTHWNMYTQEETTAYGG